MKILVPVKRVPDPTQKAKLKDGHIDLDRRVVDRQHVRRVRGRDGAAVAGERRDEHAQAGGEIVVVSLGPKMPRRRSGPDARDGRRSRDPRRREGRRDRLAGRRQGAAAIVAAEKPDLVVMGKQAVDGDANQVGQMLAGKLGWPQATFAASIEISRDKTFDRRPRGRRRGRIQARPVPSVVTVDLRIVGAHAVATASRPRRSHIPARALGCRRSRASWRQRRSRWWSASSATTAPSPRP